MNDEKLFALRLNKAALDAKSILIAHELIKQRPDLVPTVCDNVDTEGWTLVGRLANKGFSGPLRLLLSIAPNAVNKRGAGEVTVMHVAALRGRPNIVHLLKSYGADPNVKDATGRTPLDVTKDEVVIKVLKGADITSSYDGQFFVGDQVFANNLGHYYPATIVAIQRPKEFYRVHYHGWGKQYDENLPLASIISITSENLESLKTKQGSVITKPSGFTLKPRHAKASKRKLSPGSPTFLGNTNGGNEQGGSKRTSRGSSASPTPLNHSSHPSAGAAPLKLVIPPTRQQYGRDSPTTNLKHAFNHFHEAFSSWSTTTTKNIDNSKTITQLEGRIATLEGDNHRLQKTVVDQKKQLGTQESLLAEKDRELALLRENLGKLQGDISRIKTLISGAEL